jgi:flagellar hook-associated protein 2
MATTATSSIQGLSSNIQWQDLIDQIISLEQARTLTPVTTQISKAQTSVGAWQSYQTLVAAVQTSATSLRDSAFDAVKTSGGTTAGGQTILTSSATSAATPGTYQTEVLSLATADKLSSASVADAAAPLHLPGEFWVNGRRVNVDDGASLSSLRDTINALNTGTSPTGVQASILSLPGAGARLVLTATQPGAGGVQLTDGSSGVLSSLGLIDASAQSVTTANGGAETYRFADSTTALGTLLGATTLPPAANIVVGNTTISVDLSTDSLDSILQKIQTAGVSASVSSPSFNGTTMSRLDIGAPVSAVAGDADSQRIVQMLGFAPGRTGVAQVIADTSAWTDGSASPATASTALTDLRAGGTAVNLAAGDTIVINGARGDGVAVSTTLTLTGNETVQSLLDKLNGTGMFGNVSRSATVSLVNGALTLTDDTAGASQLSLAMVVRHADGTTGTLGQLSAQTVGYDRELSHGSDAAVRIDGTLITRSSNTIADAIPGVTLNLQAAAPGSTADVVISRDTSSMVDAVKGLVSAYNAVGAFVKSQTSSTGQLPYDVSLRTSYRSLTATLLGDVPGVTGVFKNLNQVGVSIDKNGVFSVDADALTKALSTNMTDVKALFARTATGSAGLTFMSDSAKTQSGTYAVDVTAPATQATLLGLGFTGSYVDSGTPDEISIVDGASLSTATISLATATVSLETGDDINAIVTKLNAAFASQKMSVIAEATLDGQLSIKSRAYGNAARLSFAYGAGAANAQTQLGIVAGSVAGTDVVGTIDGVAAVGLGQRLTAGAGTNAEGLSMLYTGTTPFTGSMTYTLGMAGAMANFADAIARSGDGLVATTTESLQQQIDKLTQRTNDIQARLDLHKQTLTQQFTKMEAALAALQTQSTALANQIKALQSSND